MTKKDTIYLEPDDEITTVIDKLQQSQNSVVALVLPQRANVFQSIVNMKLLKRSATKYKKQVALVTSDATVVKLAGLSGIHVAKTLQSKPEIPKVDTAKPAAVEEKLDSKEKPEAKVAGAIGAAATDDSIELDNSTPLAEAATKTKSAVKRIKIPDFGSFRTRLFLVVFAALLLIVGSVLAFVVLPKATVKIKTDTKGVDTAFNFTASASAKDFDAEAGILPAGLAEVTKTDTEKVEATGQKNIGEKADGTMTITNCNRDDETITVAAGTVFSAGGFNFRTSEAISVAASNFTGGGLCKKDKSATVAVVATEPGENYNLSARTYSTQNPDISGQGSQMTGGTNNVVKVVTAQDIEDGKQRLAGRSKSAAFDELKAKLEGLELKPLDQTLDETEPKVETNVGVDQQADEVTVTGTTVYKMLGVREEQLKELLDKSIQAAMAEEQQKIQDNGLSAATLTVTEKASPTEQKLQLKTVATVGPDMNIEQIKALAAGKKRGEIQEEIGNIDGVREVSVEYSPFWVLQTPKSASKIEVVLEQQN